MVGIRGKHLDSQYKIMPSAKVLRNYLRSRPFLGHESGCYAPVEIDTDDTAADI